MSYMVEKHELRCRPNNTFRSQPESMGKGPHGLPWSRIQLPHFLRRFPVWNLLTLNLCENEREPNEFRCKGQPASRRRERSLPDTFAQSSSISFENLVGQQGIVPSSSSSLSAAMAPNSDSLGHRSSLVLGLQIKFILSSTAVMLNPFILRSLSRNICQYDGNLVVGILIFRPFFCHIAAKSRLANSWRKP